MNSAKKLLFLYVSSLLLCGEVQMVMSESSLSLGVVQAQTVEEKKAEAYIFELQGLEQYQIAQFKEARESWQKALKFYQEINDYFGIAASLNNLGEVHRRLVEYDEAINYHQQSLAISKEIGNSAGVATSLSNLGHVYLNLEEYDKTINYYQQSLSISKDIGHYSSVVNSLIGLGDLLENLGEYERAIENYQQSLSISREIIYHRGISASLNNLGIVYEHLGEYEKSIGYYKQSLAIDEEIGDRAGISASLHGLGTLYQRLGEYRKAIDYYQQSFAIDEEIGDHTGVSNSLNNLGNIYQNLSEYGKAIDYYQQSLLLDKEINNYSGVAASLNNLGIVYRELGEYENAIDYCQQSLSISEQFGIPSYILASLNNLSSIYLELKEYQIAINYAQQSLNIAQEIGELLGVSTSLNNLGDVYQELEEYENAIDYYQQSLVISKKIGTRSNISASLNNLGLIHGKLDEYQKAIHYFQQSLAIDNEINARSSAAISYDNLGSLLKAKNQPSLAIVFYKASVNLYEQIRLDIEGLPLKTQETYLSTVESTYRDLADLQLSQGRIAEAQQVLELLKVQEIIAYTRSSSDIKSSESTTFNPQETDVRNTHGSLIALTRKILDCDIDGCDDNTYQSLLNDLDIVSGNYENAVLALENRLTQRTENFTIQLREQCRADEEENCDRLTYSDNAFLEVNRLTEAASQIVESQPNTVLLYPLILDDKIWILWTAQGGLTSSVQIEGVGLKELSTEIVKLRTALEDPFSNINNLQAISNKIHDWLLPPELTKELEENGITNLVFSLDSVTRYIPMEVLFDGEDYLVDNYTISTIISAGLTDLEKTMPIAPQVLASGVSEAALGFNALPNVTTELDTIVREDESDHLGVYPGEVLLNKDFTKTSLTQNIRRHNILHIATHGEFVPGDNEASYLLMGDETKYPIPEIQKLRGLSNVHLVVLSACETALGGEGTDGTELAGISYYFLNNAADSVLASLWKVDDRSTSLLMELFYQNLATGQSKAAALRNARLSLRNSDEQLATNLSRGWGNIQQQISNQSPTTNFEHPYHWASFILIGNGL